MEIKEDEGDLGKSIGSFSLSSKKAFEVSLFPNASPLLYIGLLWESLPLTLLLK